MALITRLFVAVLLVAVSGAASGGRLDDHLFGAVFLLVNALRQKGARRDPDQPPVRDANTERPNWGAYFVVFGERAEA